MKYRYVWCDVIRSTLDFNYNLIIVQMIILLSLLNTCTGVNYLQNGIIKIAIATKRQKHLSINNFENVLGDTIPEKMKRTARSKLFTQRNNNPLDKIIKHFIL